jgi:glycine/D-amino acid oxidase-like deaminating enzyme/nitrite reductase/ring-hydroxylating ferredoxin subunit
MGGVTTMASSARPVVETAEAASVPGLRRTVWEQQDQKPQYPKLESEVSADVVIVGAGISGLSIAYNLLKTGKSVIVLESRVVGAGMTGRNTAHIMPWFDDYYHLVEKLHGFPKTKQVANSYLAAIDFIEETVKSESIECGFERVDGYLYPHDDSDDTATRLQKEFDVCKRLGLDVEFVNLENDPSTGSVGRALKFANAGQFNPIKYVNGLAKAVTSKGGKLYETTKVRKFDNNDVTTADGIKVKAGAVVMATYTPLHRDQLIHTFQQPEYYYAIGLKIPKGSVKKALWWDTESPYHNVRIEEREEHDILIVGGEDHNAGKKFEDYTDAYSSLEKWAKKRWTSAGDVLYKWTGQVYKPVGFVPLIGPDPLANVTSPVLAYDQYVSTGDSGQGMTSGTIAGLLITDLITGKPNPWAEIYSPKRGAPTTKETVAGTGVRLWNTYEGIKDLLPFVGADSVDIEDLAPCGGCVVQSGISKVAVYKDEHGQVHKYSAVCPHLGCVVKWNPIDGVFNCPCHGSIFDHKGTVINGPANVDLSPVD